MISTILLTPIALFVSTPVFAAEDCSAQEAKILDCIRHPEWRGEPVMKCSEAERDYFQCGMKRQRESASGNSAAQKERLTQEIAFTEKKIEAYQAAQKVCAEKADTCTPERKRVIDKMAGGLPKQLAKLKTHLAHGK
jgi:hypothetical protein